MSITMYDSEEGYQQLLNQINKIMAEKKIDLVKEFKEAIGDAKTEEDTENVKGNDEKAEGNEISTADKTSNSDEEVQLAEKVAFTIKDVKRAMKADQAEIDEAKEKQETVSDRIITVTDYLPRYQNKAINFTGEDMGSDKIMFLIFDYIVVAILAFVFAVTTSNTITSEAGVIGTLRASGYTRSEILRHYMVLPVLVTVIAAVIGNIFGYTFMKKYMVDLYYGSYSLATYKTLWNAEAFIDTTVVPIILMFLINFFMISSKLKLSPLRFLRRDLSKRGKKKAFRLNTKIPIMIRFRIRILFQNIPNYITLAIGVFFGGAIVIFGLMFGPMLEDYSDMIQKSMIANYQYVLMNQEETNTKDAEKYCVTSLMNTEEKFMIDEVMIYGVEENSAYIKDEIPEGKVYVSNGMAAKYKLKKGSKFELKSPYGNERYEFEVAGEYKYDAALSIFLPRTEFNQRFDKKDDYFTGYFSNEGIHDIDEDAIVNVITLKDLTKVSDQLHVSIGSMTSLFQHFGVVMFLLLMFIMSKQIIEKNSQSISMTKILGFRNGEIGGLYIVATSIIVLLSLLISIPLVNGVLRWIFSSYIYTAMTGYLPFIVSSSCYIKMFLMGVACYLFVGVFQLRKIGKISKSDALKNVE